MSRCRSMKARPINSPKSYVRSAPSGASRSSGSTSSSLAPVSTMTLAASLSITPCRAFSTAILAEWAFRAAMRSMTAARDATEALAASSTSSSYLIRTLSSAKSADALASILSGFHLAACGYASM